MVRLGQADNKILGQIMLERKYQVRLCLKQMVRLGYDDHKRLSQVRLCNAEIKYLARSKEAENDFTGLGEKSQQVFFEHTRRDHGEMR